MNEKPSPAPGLRALLEDLGVVLVDDGDVLVGMCPLHEAPSETRINPQEDTWSCPTCGITDGTVVTWVAKSKGVSEAHAEELLRAGAVEPGSKGRHPRQKGVVVKHSTVRALPPLFDVADSDEAILAAVSKFYQEAFAKNEDALAFLETHKISSAALEAFQVGFSDRTLGLRIPLANRVLGRQLRDRLRNLGVLRQDSGHEHLVGCVTVPTHDLDGRVVQIFGVRIERQRHELHDKELWLSRPKSGLVNIEGLRNSKEILVAGSILDALALWSEGFKNVTAIHDHDGPVEDLLRAVEAFKTERITLVFPRDPQFGNAVVKLAPALAALHVEVLAAQLPMGLDVGDVLRLDDGAFRLRQAVRSAEWVAGVRAPRPKAPGGPQNAPQSVPGPFQPPVAATATPKSSEPSLGVTDEAVLTFEDRRWRIRGQNDNRSRGTLKVNVLVSMDPVGFHVDTFDLYSSRHRAAFLKQASLELGLDEATVKKDLGQVLLNLEQAQEDLLRSLQAPKPKTYVMSPEEREAALSLLRDPQVLDRVSEAFETVGVVGETDNLMLGFLASVSRKLRRPLGVVVQSSSAAGKSSLMEAVLSFVPEEDLVSYSAMTGQSLFYSPASNLRHKVLSIAEEEGAARASYSLKLLQSEGHLTIASTSKESSTGRLVSQEYRVEGPVAVMLTTTSIDIDEELLSRCIVLTVDESPAQTRRIHEHQRRRQTLEGVLGGDAQDRVLKLHQNAQRLLRPVRVVNPYVSDMTFADLRVRARRDHQKLLTLIETIAFVHQHQRPVKTAQHLGNIFNYIEVEKSDIEMAERLLRAAGAIGVGDVPPQTKKLLDLVVDFVRQRLKINDGDVRFTRRELREKLLLGDTTLKTHLHRLVDAELLLAHRMPGRGIAYELAVDVCDYDPQWSGHRSPLGQAMDGPRSGGGQGATLMPNPSNPIPNPTIAGRDPEKSHPGPQLQKRIVGASNGAG